MEFLKDNSNEMLWWKQQDDQKRKKLHYPKYQHDWLPIKKINCFERGIQLTNKRFNYQDKRRDIVTERVRQS